MRQHFLALMLLGVLMRGVYTGPPKCQKPNGKIGQTKVNGCGSKVCKKSGGGGAWESCPLPASAETVQEEIKSIRTVLKEILTYLGPAFDVVNNALQTNNDLLNELVNRPGFYPGSGLNVVFELKEEFNIAKGFLMGTLPYIGKQYKIKFEWFIKGFGSGYQNIIHFTTGGDGGWGERTPGVWLHNDNWFSVHSAIKPSGVIDEIVSMAAKTGIWMTMEISQYMIADNKFEYLFKVDGKIWTLPNTKPEAFEEVKMYAGDPWHTALNGKIRNLQVLTRND